MSLLWFSAGFACALSLYGVVYLFFLTVVNPFLDKWDRGHK